jgi:hypothetical protein
MKIWRADIVMPAIILGIGLGICLVGLTRGFEPKPDPERARFMLECAYDWSLSPQTCRKILNGEDPPVPPPEYDGC